MATVPRTFARQIGYLITCVMPADVLSAEPIDGEDGSNLRADASRNGLSYLQVVPSLEEGRYLVRIVATPECARKGYTVILSEEDLFQALPWEPRLAWQDHLSTRKRHPAAILALLRSHAREVQPLTKQLPGFEQATPFPTEALTVVDMIEVSQDVLQDAIITETAGKDATVTMQRRTNPSHLQQALFQAMIDTLIAQLSQINDAATTQALQARCALIAQLQRWQRYTQERLINVVPRYSPEHHQVVWRLTVGVPIMSSLAA
jgi:hypothetical protein